jgi:hypothetical protein
MSEAIVESAQQTKEETARLRLRAQKEAHEKSLREAGLKAGREFVVDIDEQGNEYSQLVALERHQEHHDPPEDLADLIAAMDATDTVIAADWQALYEHPVYLLETFIDPERFAGTCYRAANWLYLGLTTGRGKDDQTNRPNRSLKQLWAYPLRPDFRRRLCGAGCG